MNLVGKIFIVLVFAMSLVFMTMSMNVFMTQTKWNEVVDNTDTTGGKKLGLKQQLAAQKAINDEVEAENAKLKASIDKEKARKVQALASLETERYDKDQKLGLLGSQLASKVAEHRAAIGEIESLTSLIIGLQREVDGGGEVPGLRAKIAATEVERDKILKQVLKLTDESNQANGDVWRLTQTKKTLEQQLGKAIAVLKDRGLSIETPRRGLPPDPLNGLVSKVSKTGKLVEVTVGYDDGLRKDHTMEVYNDRRYLGRMKVIETKPDSAVGRMETINGRIQRGDRVATKLKVG
jgi:hypothetical protein